jgi:succinate-acetate transporter protein
VSLSRFLCIGGIALLIAGIVLAAVGASIAGMAAASCGAVFLVSWVFLLIGLSEDRDRERGDL